MDNACRRYINGLGGKLKFKKINGIKSYRTICINNNIEVLDNFIKLPTLGKVKAKVHRKVEGNIINTTIKKYGDNKYKVMILVKREIKKLEKSSYIVGIDMGVSTFITDNVGNTYDAPKALIKYYDEIGELQKELALKREAVVII